VGRETQGSVDPGTEREQWRRHMDDSESKTRHESEHETTPEMSAEFLAPTSAARDQLVARCRAVLNRLVAFARPQLSDWLALDLGMGHFKAMLVLGAHERLTVGGLARALGVSEPSASLLVDKLVTRGLADRRSDPADRRRAVVSLTPQAHELLNRLRQMRDEHLISWLSLLSETELGALLHGLEALLRAVEAPGQPAQPPRILGLEEAAGANGQKGAAGEN
jgi:MarR family transcriptional regulator for hemolysin